MLNRGAISVYWVQRLYPIKHQPDYMKNLYSRIIQKISRAACAYFFSMCLTIVTMSMCQEIAAQCDNVIDGGIICCAQTGCGNFDPAPLTSTTNPTGGSGTLDVMWKRRSASTGMLYQTILGATGLSYDPGIITETTYYKRFSRRSGCVDYVGESNEIMVGVTPCDYSGTMCFNGTNNPVGAEVLFLVDYDINPALGTVTVRTTFSKNFVDNTYGINKIGWPGGHTFGNLTGSDHLQLAMLDANNVRKLEFKIDYITSSNLAPSGYKCLGVTGGDGNMVFGSALNVLSATTSLDKNFNEYGYVLPVNSPATDANYTPNPAQPDWIYDVWYEVVVKLDAFGNAGFGTVDIAGVHASPSKTGNNTEPVLPGACPCTIICPTDFTVECSDPRTPDVTGAPTSSCNALWTYTDEYCAVPLPPDPNNGQICFGGSANENIGATTTYSINPTANSGTETVTIRTTLTKNFVDNTYGTNKIDWPGNHTFNNLTGSDKLRLALYDASNVKKLEFEIDYLTSSNTVPSGYKCLGVTGGDGQMIFGSSLNVLSATTSLDKNFNTYGYVLTSNSPATTSSYAINETYPNWIYEVWYEVTVKLTAFGAAGFGSVNIADIHASPSKTGNNSEPMAVIPCMLPCNGNTSSNCITRFLRHWTSAAASGSCDQLITVVDNLAPVANMEPTDLTIPCNTPPPAAPNVTFDDCHSLTTTYNQTSVVNPNGTTTYTRIWTANDGCGHSTTVDQIITTQLCTVKVGDYVWNDANYNGQQDSGEAAVPNVTVRLYNTGTDGNAGTADDVLIATTSTNSSGLYLFTVEITGEYFIVFDPSTLPANFAFTSPDLGNNNTDSDAGPNGRTDEFNIALGQADDLSWDAGVYNCPTPTVTSQPGANSTVSCAQDIPQITTPIFSDPSDAVLDIVLNEVFTGTDCNLTIVRTWTATNDCGNNVSVSQTIQVFDNIPPVLSGVPADLIMECGDPVASLMVTATDNCTSNPNIGLNAVTTQQACGYTFVRTWTAFDDCGNSSSATQTITFVDTTPPQVTNPPLDIDVECSTTVPDYLPIWTDNCDNNPTLSSSSYMLNDDCHNILVQSYTATDHCGNTMTIIRNINIVDTTPPVIGNMPPDFAAECGAVPSSDSPSATDNCDANPAITFDETIVPGNGCEYFILRTWTAVDDCGNSTSDTQLITVTDTIEPVLIDVPADGSMECSAIIPAGNVTASDNCDANPLVTFSQQIIPGDDCAFTIIRTWTAIDACGNESAASQTLEVTDESAPTLVGVPSDETVDCGSIPTAAVVMGDDNCDDNVEITFTEDISAGCPYTITRTWIGTDNCGNTASATQVIIVVDTTPPILYGVPANQTMQCNSPVVSSVVAATDNCGNDLEIDLAAITELNECGSTFTRTWTVTDDCGNTTTATQVITFVDTIPPYIIENVPSEWTINCDETAPEYYPAFGDNCDADLNLNFISGISNENNCGHDIERTWTATDDCGNTTTITQIIHVVDSTPPGLLDVPEDTIAECGNIPEIGIPTATDNCDDVVEITFNQTTIAGNNCTYSLERTWTATDDCGNNVSATQIITVYDTSAPILIGVPDDATVECSALTNVPDIAATDFCDPIPTIHFEEEMVAGDQCSFELIRTWTATDACGNVTTASQTLNVVDTTPPVFNNIPADATIDCGSIPALDILSASDNCDENVDVTFNEEISEGCPYTITRTWTATDNCANSTSASQVLTIVDTTPPVLYGVPSNMTLQCNTPVPSAVVVASDNCSADMQINLTAETISNNCGSVFTRTWSVSDDCGNETIATQVITFVDTTAPYVIDSVPAELSLECTENEPEYLPTFGDNCDTELALTFTSDIANTSVCGYDIERVWTATDDCGNNISIQQIIHIYDTTPPVLEGVPDNTLVECGSIPEPATVTASDNCSSPLVTMEQTTEGSCPYTITRTWTATDGCGNTVSASQIITVEDITPAYITNNPPTSFNVECGQQIPENNPEFADACDQNLSIQFTELPVSGNCPGGLLRSWKVIDQCGNQLLFDQFIFIDDTTAPTVSVEVPVELNIECDQTTSDEAPQFADACDSDLTITATFEIVNSSACGHDIVRRWTATDDCENSTVVTQTIHVSDTTPPVILTWPANESFSCDETIPAAGEVTAIDNCDLNPIISFIENLITANCGYYIVRAWTVTDHCGNSSSVTQTIYILDELSPVLAGVPPDVTIECGQPLPLPSNFTATDNCDVNPTLQINDVVIQGSCGYQIKRYYKATDHCGNTVTQPQIITVTDTTPPIIVAPADVIVACTQIPAVAELAATDNCDLNVNVVFTQVTESGCPYSIIRTWSATDHCGNQTVVSQMITVIDEIAPVFLPYQYQMQMECDALATYTLQATDNCDNDVQVTIIEETVASGGCYGNLIRTYRAMDHCGNATTTQQIISVMDNTPPEIQNVPEDITITCGSALPQVPGNIYATDNCTASENMQVTFTQIQTGTFCPYEIIRIWTTIDHCENRAAVSQTIDVVVDTPSSAEMSARPNPALQHFIFSFSVPTDRHVSGAIHDITGRLVMPLYTGPAEGGRLYAWDIDASDFEAGSYIIRMSVGDEILHQTLIITGR